MVLTRTRNNTSATNRLPVAPSRMHNQVPIETKRLARLEALLSGMPGDRELRLLLEQLDSGPGGSFTWLDPRSTAITVLPSTMAST